MPEASVLLGATGVLAAVLTLTWVTATGTAMGAGRGLALAATGPWFETARLLRQRRRTTLRADVLLWRLSGWSLLPLAVLLVALVPWGPHVLVPTELGVVWANALDVVVWAAVWLLGWGANAVAGLVGGYRFLALALGYELPLMFALVAPAMAASSLDLAVIADAQSDLWFVVWMPVAFLAYLVGVLGFALHGPLAAPDPVWVAVKAIVLTALLSYAAGRLPRLRVPLLLGPAWVVLLPLVVLQDLVVGVVLL